MDELLIRKAKRGDKDSFTQAIYEIKDQAYRIAYCYLHNEEDSMDAVCDAIEKAYNNLKKLKQPKYFKTWFIRITINECKLQLRDREKAKRLADNLYEFQIHKIKEEEMDLNALVSKLPEADRMLIYMKYYMGYTLEEISRIMEMPEGTVKTRIYSNLKKMKQQLEFGEV